MCIRDRQNSGAIPCKGIAMPAVEGQVEPAQIATSLKSYVVVNEQPPQVGPPTPPKTTLWVRQNRPQWVRKVHCVLLHTDWNVTIGTDNAAVMQGWNQGLHGNRRQVRLSVARGLRDEVLHCTKSAPTRRNMLGNTTASTGKRRTWLTGQQMRGSD
eukprot:1313780-Amphidinium_carterae.1